MLYFRVLMIFSFGILGGSSSLCQMYHWKCQSRGRSRGTSNNCVGEQKSNYLLRNYLKSTSAKDFNQVWWSQCGCQFCTVNILWGFLEPKATNGVLRNILSALNGAMIIACSRKSSSSPYKNNWCNILAYV